MVMLLINYFYIAKAQFQHYSKLLLYNIISFKIKRKIVTLQKLSPQLQIAYFFNSVAIIKKIQISVWARSTPLRALIKFLMLISVEVPVGSSVNHPPIQSSK